MTPNGAIIFGLVAIAGSVAAGSLPGLAVMLAVALIFALGSRQSIVSALNVSAGIVLPLAAFMGLVWIGLVGRAPHEIAAGIAGSRAAATLFVAITCLRLFVIAFAVQAAFLHFSGWTPLRFVRSLAAPLVIKKLLVLTLSLIETILHAIDRARTALISAGIITRQASWRNLRNGWILVQTVWLTVVTIAIGRTRDKWPVENTLARLDGTLAAQTPRLFNMTDLAWTALAAVGLILAVGLR
jgi:F0F1-type ATP synthase assembly protein I